MGRHGSCRLPQRRSDDCRLEPPIGGSTEQSWFRLMWACDVPRRTITEGWSSSRPVTFPETPSRPGRLVAVTACPGRHETPETQLGRPGGPPALALRRARE